MVSDVKKYVIPAVLLFMFWLVLSPGFTLQTVVFGLVISGLVMFYSREILFSAEEMPLYRLSNLINMGKFTGVLLVEIVKANIDVAKIVLNPKLPIEPEFIRVPTSIQNDVNKVIFGNSVTLTPGTLTVDIDESDFIIHALTKEAAQAMEDSFIEEWINRQEEKR